MHHGVTAHRVADECDLVRANLIDDGDDIVTERREGPIGTAEPRLAVASQVDRYDLLPLGQVVDLVSPIGAIACPAIHEYHRWPVAGAIGCIRDLDAVTAGCHLGKCDWARWKHCALHANRPSASSWRGTAAFTEGNSRARVDATAAIASKEQARRAATELLGALRRVVPS